jgi:DNA polymerase elongation subunit (family B)
MTKFYTRVDSIKDDLLVCGYEDGKRFKKKVRYRPYLFTPSRDGSKFRTIDGREVGKVQFESIREAHDFIKLYKESANAPVFGLNKFPYVYIYDTYKGEIDYDPSLMSIVTIDIEVDISGDTGFPRPDLAQNEITLITISRNGKKAVFGCQSFDNKDESVTYYKCADEVALLRSFLDVWNSVEYSPDIVTGWNVEFFDIPYVINRMSHVLGGEAAKKLSPWRHIKKKNINRGGRDEETYDMYGISILDYMALYRKFGFKVQESYSLDYISNQELGEQKVDYKSAGYESLADLQVRNWQLYTEYNIRDVDLVDRLDDKLKLIELCMAMAYDAKVNYQDTFTTVGLWDTIIHNYLLDRNYVVPQLKVGDLHSESILGGYVKDPQVGEHKWVISLDLNSLYPHIIMQYNISPETYAGVFPKAPLLGVSGASTAEPLVEEMLKGYLNEERRSHLVGNDLTMTANMRTFTRSKQGFLAAIMQKMYEDRVVYKKQMIEASREYQKTGDADLGKRKARFHNLQMAKKIQLNSGYGALANPYNRWYRAEFAEAITASGQLATRWIEVKLNEYLNDLFRTGDEDYVIACDTDSVYLRAERFVEVADKEMDTRRVVAYLDKVCARVLEPFIDKKYEELCVYVNGTSQKMKMKRECIANKGIWTAKKRYMLNVYNEEGIPYDTPKLKMMGIEAIRTSTPEVCRSAIKDTITIIMDGTEADMQKYVADFRAKFNSLTFAQIASPRGVNMNKIEPNGMGGFNKIPYACSRDIYKKGTPIQVKGALLYNHLLKEKKLTKKFEAIADGQKIKYSYLKMPNPIRSNVIAAPGDLPSELGLDKYLDHGLQFEKAYLEPIKTICDAIGWAPEKKYTLEDLWS